MKLVLSVGSVNVIPSTVFKVVWLVVITCCGVSCKVVSARPCVGAVVAFLLFDFVSTLWIQGFGCAVDNLVWLQNSFDKLCLCNSSCHMLCALLHPHMKWSLFCGLPLFPAPSFIILWFRFK